MSTSEIFFCVGMPVGIMIFAAGFILLAARIIEPKDETSITVPMTYIAGVLIAVWFLRLWWRNIIPVRCMLVSLAATLAVTLIQRFIFKKIGPVPWK